MKPAAALIGALPQASVGRIRDGEAVSLDLDGATELIGPEDVEITVETAVEFDVEADGRFIVYLDTELTPELVVEGWAREVINRVNGLRKERGLAVDDRIRLRLRASGSEALERALRDYGDLIQSETLAVDLEEGEESFPGGETETFDFEGQVSLTASLVCI
jgi:isoleucyl-tRNA synthetase